MQYLDLTVIRQALDWARAGETLWLCTVLSTFGSSPREPGAWLVARRDGEHVGSLSGGCVEEDFLERLAKGAFAAPVQRVRYGDGEEAGLSGSNVTLPCGGSLEVLVERLVPGETTLAHLSALEQALTGQRPRMRHVDLSSGQARLEDDSGLGDRVIWPQAENEAPGTVQLRIGPAARLVLAGMSPVAEACAEFAQRLGFEVIVCDPRLEVLETLNLSGVERVAMLPSAFIADGGCHAATAVVALTHDPRLDDLAMIEAVRTEAF